MAVFDESPLTDDFKVIAQQSDRVFSQEVTAEVNRIWDEAVENYTYLFNGQFFSYEYYEQQTLYGQFLEYKYFYASAVDRELRTELQLVPVGVTGLTKCEGKTLIGRRSDTVTLFRGLFEFVPAGSLDPQALVCREVDLHLQYRQELEEEAGISVEYIEAITPFLLVRDNKEGLVEIFAHIQLQERVARLTAKESKEYSELLWLDDDSLHEHFQAHRKEYVPITRYFLGNSQDDS